MIYVHKTAGTWKQIHGNPTLTMLDGSARATWRTISSPGWPEDYVNLFGIHHIEITPPEGMEWTGEFEEVEGRPEPTFNETLPVIPEEVEGWQAEVAMKATPVDPDDPESQSVWDRVQDLIAAMPDGIQKITAQTVLSRGKIRRDSPMLAQLALMVPLTEEQVDDLLRLAESIEA